MKSTRCLECGAAMAFKTRPPLRCPDCNRRHRAKRLRDERAYQIAVLGHPKYESWR